MTRIAAPMYTRFEYELAPVPEVVVDVVTAGAGCRAAGVVWCPPTFGCPITMEAARWLSTVSAALEIPSHGENAMCGSISAGCARSPLGKISRRGRRGRESGLLYEESPDVALPVGVGGIALDAFLEELALLIRGRRDVAAKFELIRGGEAVGREERADVAALSEFDEPVARRLRDLERPSGPLLRGEGVFRVANERLVEFHERPREGRIEEAVLCKDDDTARSRRRERSLFEKESAVAKSDRELHEQEIDAGRSGEGRGDVLPGALHESGVDGVSEAAELRLDRVDRKNGRAGSGSESGEGDRGAGGGLPEGRRVADRDADLQRLPILALEHEESLLVERNSLRWEGNEEGDVEIVV